MKSTIIISFLAFFVCSSLTSAENLWVEYKGKDGPGKGKHIVLISGDEEYRSEEALPQLGKILSQRHGFDCTVLFAVDPESGEINPDNQTSVPGIEKVATADMLILALRFREYPDDKMKYIHDFINSGKPILGLRTSTHAFNYSRNKQSKYAKYSFNHGNFKGGFGQQVLGDTWINHHGHNKKESTRGIINKDHATHPILRGVENVWGDTDVYGVKNLTDDANILMYGQVLQGMKPTDPPVEGKKNNPMMPIVWTKSYTGETNNTARIICTTMGSSTDLTNEGLRRVVVNSVYWGLGMERHIPAKSDVEIVGEYKPTNYGFHTYTKGVKPSDHNLK